MLFTSTMNRIDPLPNVMKYIIASISFFIMVSVIMIIIALSITEPSPESATSVIQTAFKI